MDLNPPKCLGTCAVKKTFQLSTLTIGQYKARLWNFNTINQAIMDLVLERYVIFLPNY